jgi:tetratricopeptide (TPR) repeat protein
MNALLMESEVVAVAEPKSARPADLNQCVTPLAEALGIEDDGSSSVLVQAEALVERHPESSIAKLRLAQAAQMAGFLADASDAARSAIVLSRTDEFGNAATRNGAMFLLAANQCEEAEELLASSTLGSAAVIRAGLLADSGDRESALALLDGLDGPLVRSMQGWLLTDLDPGRAVSALRKAASNGMRSIDVLINLGYCYGQLGAIAKAIRVTREATVVDPPNRVAAYNLTVFLHRSGDDQAALNEYGRISKWHPLDPHLALYAGWAHVHYGDDALSAIRSLRRSRERIRWGIPIHKRDEIDCSIAYLEWRSGKLPLAGAIKLLRARLDSSAPSVEVPKMLGNLLVEADDAAALRGFAKAVAGRMSEAELATHRARAALIDGHPAEAVDLVTKALEQPLDDAEARGFCAYVVAEILGEYARAVDIVEQAWRKFPDAATGNNLAFAMALSGRARDAMDAIQRIGGEEALPFQGATAALVEICLGDVEGGLKRYERAIEDLQGDGESELASLVAWRRDLALVELGLSAALPIDVEPPGKSYSTIRTVLRAVSERVLGPNAD